MREITKTASRKLGLDVMSAKALACLIRYSFVSKRLKAAIATSAGYSYRYLRDLNKDRPAEDWIRIPEMEAVIATSANYSHGYLYDLNRDRSAENWVRIPAMEAAIATSANYSHGYLYYLNRDRPAENWIRIPEMETAITTDAKYSYSYLVTVNRGRPAENLVRIPAMEATIATRADLSRDYFNQTGIDLTPPKPAKKTSASKLASRQFHDLKFPVFRALVSHRLLTKRIRAAAHNSPKYASALLQAMSVYNMNRPGGGFAQDPGLEAVVAQDPQQGAWHLRLFLELLQRQTEQTDVAEQELPQPE